MKLTVLGKYGPFPAAGGGTSSYLLSCGGKQILMDAGSGSMSRLQQFLEVEQLDAVLLSHLHHDHCSEMNLLKYVKKADIPVYLSATPQREHDQIAECARFLTQRITDGLCVMIGEAEVTFFAVRHPVECYAIKICAEKRTLVYTGDTVYFDALADFCTGADALLIDSGFLTTQPWREGLPHLYVEQAAQLAAKAGVGKLYLSHINPDYKEQDILQESRAFARRELVQEMQTYEI